MAVLKVPVTKGKGTVEIDTGNLPDAVYAEALLQGLKVLVNRGMTKITKETYPDEAELRTAAMAKAEETLAAMQAGKIRIMGAKAEGKASGAVMTEARRLARNIVKDEMKRQGIKVSYVAAKDITEAANALIAANPELIEKAKAALAEREVEASKVASSIDVSAIPISPKLKAAAEAKKVEGKTQLSAAKAGKTKKSQPPQINA